MACVNVVAAETDAVAGKLATSVMQAFKGIITGQRKLLPPPVDDMDAIWSIEEKAAAMQMMRYSFIGSPEKIKQELNGFLASTGVNEIMAASYIFSH